MAMTGTKHALIRVTLLLLVFEVAGLAILAKHNQYLPKSDPAHFLSNATKMKVGGSPNLFVPIAAPGVGQIYPPESEFGAIALARPENYSLRQIGITISLQHRSPPNFLN
jgi:hypothetical protein